MRSSMESTLATKQRSRRKDSPISFFFFARIGRSDLTRKLEKVGPFECDELEKHCRVGAKCYPTRVPALYTMTKEKFKSVFLLLLLVSRQTKSQLLMIVDFQIGNEPQNRVFSSKIVDFLFSLSIFTEGM